MAETLGTQVTALQLPSYQVTANFYRPSFATGRSLHTYSLSVSPQLNADSRAVRRRLLQSVAEQLQTAVGAHVLSGQTLFATAAVAEPLDFSTESDGVQYTLRLKYCHEVSLQSAATVAEATMILNVILKRALRALGLKQVTRLPKYYDETKTRELPDLGLQVWRGYAAQMSSLSGQVLLNVDFSSKVVHSRSLLEELCEYRDMGGDWRAAASADLEGRIVMAKYGNRRCYRVDEIVYTKSPQDALAADNPLTFVEYYQQQYQAQVEHVTQPLIRTRTRRSEEDIYLVPELVTLTGLSASARANFKTMSRLAESTRLDPSDRVRVCNALPALLANDPRGKTDLAAFDLSVDPQPIKLTAYTLSGESIFIGPQTSYPVQDNGNFTIRDRGILSSITLSNWAVAAPEHDREAARFVVSSLLTRLREISPDTVQPLALWYGGENPVEKVVAEYLKTAKVEFLLILFTRDLKNRYPALKKTTSTEFAVPSQVLVIPLQENRALPIINKVALQIQAKLGAQLWTLKPMTEFGKYVMVVGIDLFHDIVNRKKSVLGFCATVHPNFSKYYSTASLQETGQEVMTAVGQHFVEACKVFREKARQYPQTVIFFRDGVGDSQLLGVREYEVETVLRACSEVEPNYSPRIIYTVVVKKTTAKLFCETQRGVGNPRPGTLVTSQIVPGTGDFYLISHCAVQGVASPTLYRTMFDSRPQEFAVESLARLAYRLCHMYYNWSGAVKVPAPCMMAHKLAYFVGQCVHESVNKSIRTLSFYL